jgi:triacylglycerol esterase/lipase EstA (alpha/beta hydrolase family)
MHPTIIIPGYLAAATDYVAMHQQLADRGIPTTTVPLRRADWLQTLGGRSVQPILALVDQAVQAAMQAHQTDRVNLVAHSAGGWIARIYLGALPYDVHGPRPGDATLAWKGHTRVAQLVTLGTPHVSQERWTRKNLDFVNDTYPGAHHDDVDYVCVAGKAIFGERVVPGANPGDDGINPTTAAITSQSASGAASWTEMSGFGRWFTQTLAGNSYEMTGGVRAAWGDGITPIGAAHLVGARNITLDGVWHSPRSPGQWYGSPDILAQWASELA